MVYSLDSGHVHSMLLTLDSWLYFNG